MNLKKIENFIDKQKVAFICSVDDENYPNVKAMLKPRKRIGLKEFYFSTNTSSMRVKQYKDNAQDYIISKYNWDNVVENTMKLYEVKNENK